MKKIILIILILFCTSCADYNDLNNLAIISGISIDYEDDEYNLAYEVLNVKSTNEEVSTKEKTYFARGKGKTITDAFYNTSKEVAKTPYFTHLKVVVIDEEIAKNKLKDITDFLLRDNSIRNIFYLVVAKDSKAFEVISSVNKNNPVISTAIKDMLNNKKNTNNIFSNLTFEEFIQNIVSKTSDGYLSSIMLDNKKLKLGPLAIFKDYEMVNFLTNSESSTVNILNGTGINNYIKVKCPNDEDKTINLTTFNKPKSKIEINNKSAKINLKLEFRILENHCNYNFKKDETYEQLEKALSKTLKSNVQNTINTLKKYDSDILKINKAYYRKYKKYIDFKELQYKIKVDAKINKNGLIFEVKNDK